MLWWFVTPSVRYAWEEHPLLSQQILPLRSWVIWLSDLFLSSTSFPLIIALIFASAGSRLIILKPLIGRLCLLISSRGLYPLHIQVHLQLPQSHLGLVEPWCIPHCKGSKINRTFPSNSSIGIVELRLSNPDMHPGEASGTWYSL